MIRGGGAMAAALLAVMLIGAAEGMLVSEACQEHCSGTYPEHTYPNVENPRACQHGCQFAKLDALISWPAEASIESCLESCREGFHHDQQYACSVGCHVRTISSLSHERAGVQMDSYLSLTKHAQQLSEWAGSYRYTEMDVVIIHSSDSNSSLETMEVVIHQTSGGVSVEHRPEKKHFPGDRFIWINMRMGCMFLLGASILFCLCAFCTGSGTEHRNLPTVSHQVCKDKAVHYNLLQPQTKQELAYSASQNMLPINVKMGKKQPYVEGVLTIVS